MEIESIRKEVLSCRKCELWKTRTNPVFGEGNNNAEIMFVGEAPGFNEDKTGRPFCGKAGKILDELLCSVNIKREEVFISNILKCRPPNNRNPRDEEINACAPYLDQQIDIIKPKTICCLGNFAAGYIMKKFGLKNRIQGISRLHGQVFLHNSIFGKLRIIPFYHPAAAVYNPNMLEVLREDFRVLSNEQQG
ncbi:MAG: uracil-DNA glycosylase [Candidatus Thermoplasmatota archaeon]|nr:uracil-DNA glycosylase [Candidatus Thermoplasmatota archaeon]